VLVAAADVPDTNATAVVAWEVVAAVLSQVLPQPASSIKRFSWSQMACERAWRLWSCVACKNSGMHACMQLHATMCRRPLECGTIHDQPAARSISGLWTYSAEIALVLQPYVLEDRQTQKFRCQRCIAVGRADAKSS